MRYINLILFVSIAAAVAGCSSNTPPPPLVGPTDPAAKTFMSTVNALPPAQRNAYVMQHPDGVKNVMSSHDGNLIMQLNTMGRPGGQPGG